MAYPKRDWANTGNEVTKDDFKRIENGIEANDLEITKQKNPTIPGTLAKKIADNVTAIEENANKINDCSKSKVLTTLAEVNNPNLESGIYSAEGEGVGMIFDGVTTNYYYTLIVNQHRTNPNFGSQIAMPYDNGDEWGIYYRTCKAGTWQPWINLIEAKWANIVLNGYSQGFITPRVLKMGNAYTITGDFNLPNAVPSGTLIGTIPSGFLPVANFHIFLDAYQIQLPFNARLWITTDGSITLHGCDTLSAGATLEFNKTIIIP